MLTMVITNSAKEEGLMLKIPKMEHYGCPLTQMNLTILFVAITNLIYNLPEKPCN